MLATSEGVRLPPRRHKERNQKLKLRVSEKRPALSLSALAKSCRNEKPCKDEVSCACRDGLEKFCRRAIMQCRSSLSAQNLVTGFPPARV